MFEFIHAITGHRSVDNVLANYGYHLTYPFVIIYFDIYIYIDGI